ncbi:MAG TPA: hypothetical protein VFE08_07700 [Candidatus Sulfotelmatobacter sp.]|nr:hypothetical protein [Candidatus Sulfotelmatobacter sp.]
MTTSDVRAATAGHSPHAQRLRSAERWAGVESTAPTASRKIRQ